MKSRSLRTTSILFSLLIAAATASFAQTFTTLVNFDGTNGVSPYTWLIQGTDGNFYGTTQYGGSLHFGTVYKVNSAGALTTLATFDGPNGRLPTGLLLASDANIYGTTIYGGPNSAGTFFRIDSQGVLTSLASFQGIGNPWGKMIQATDGNIYGETTESGINFGGTIVKVTPSGITNFYEFCSLPGCADGDLPSGSLIQATDGNLYGTDLSRGKGQWGTVFRVTLGGASTPIYNFCSLANCADGYNSGGVIEGSDGNLYGTTANGGSYSQSPCSVLGCGTVFKITPDGAFSLLYTFCSQANCNDGHGPGVLIQATDGNFYGMTSYGGSDGIGTIYRISSSGQFTKLHDFTGADGSDPYWNLLQATDGNFYGTTTTGGSGGYGTVFRLSTGLAPFVHPMQSSGKVGQTGGILGQGFIGTTGVFLNGTPAPFTIVSDTYILATVPSGATSGYITVQTPSGTLSSDVVFHVK